MHTHCSTFLTHSKYKYILHLLPKNGGSVIINIKLKINYEHRSVDSMFVKLVK